MRISFDLDDVLFVSPKTYETEPAPRFPYDRLFPERLRKGTPELIHTLQERGFEVWIQWPALCPCCLTAPCRRLTAVCSCSV